MKLRALTADVQRLRADSARPEWRETARPGQLPPDGPWRIWYVRGGRDSGKTWTGSNYFAEQILSHEPGDWAVLAPTFGDARDVCISGRLSGLIRALGGVNGPHVDAWNVSNGILKLKNGSVVYVDGADDGALRIQGKRLRGAWCDEIGLWRQWETAWDESLRYAVTEYPARIIATGTPKSSQPARVLVKRLLEDPDVPCSLLLTSDNRKHIDPGAYESMMKSAGTRLGRQELSGELLEDVEGALFTLAVIDAARVDVAPDLKRVIVGVDPAGSSKAGSDETGIIVAGLGVDGEFYILDDVSLRGTPQQWGMVVVNAYERHTADLIVAEENFGAEMVRHVVHGIDPHAPYHKERGQAGLGKQVRAEPISALYERGLVHHVGAPFPHLEDQMCSWTQDSRSSPDRLDAMVWAVRTLMKKPGARITHVGRAR